MSIFAVNENAAGLLQKGKHDEAGRTLLQGLANLRKDLESEGSENSQGVDTGSSDVLSDVVALRDEIFTVALSLEGSKSNTKPLDDKHSLDFFKSMFCLTPGSSWSTASTDVLTAISAIVMFNAALCFHLDGIKRGRSDLLRRALRVYTKCFSVINNSGVDLPLLSLATCSNMAFIQSEFYEVNALHATAGALSSLLARTSELGEEEMVFFRVQALTCKLTRARRAPAA